MVAGEKGDSGPIWVLKPIGLASELDVRAGGING